MQPLSIGRDLRKGHFSSEDTLHIRYTMTSQIFVQVSKPKFVEFPYTCHLIPLKTNMTGWNITIANRGYIFKCLFFYSHVSFWGCRSVL